MYRGVITGRSNYDDFNENRVSRKRDPNKKVGLIAGLLGVLICIVTFLIYTSMLKTKDLVSGNTPSASPAFTYTSKSESTESTESETALATETETQAETTTLKEETTETTETVSMNIDDALPKITEQSQSSATDYLSASDYSNTDETQDNVVNQGVELKKPVIRRISVLASRLQARTTL